MTTDASFTVGEFVAVLNQTLEYAFPSVTITGELANFKISKGKWVYFDLKDDEASVRFFGTIYSLPGPLEDGMMVAVRGNPRLHPQYGFSVSVQSIMPVGQGSIKKAAALLEAKLSAEGLFDEDRKRPLPYPPQHIGLVASSESAGYRDFMKIIESRWGGMAITLIDVQVQGEAAINQVCAALAQFNGLADQPDVIVVTRGGGSPEDLAVFSTEQVTRAVAASRIPTIVAIGHEIDVSLAELAADRRASTPSNAAEVLVPDRRAVLEQMQAHRERLGYFIERHMREARATLLLKGKTIEDGARQVIMQAKQRLGLQQQLLQAYDPQAALSRGYALVRRDAALIRRGRTLQKGDALEITFVDAKVLTEVRSVHGKE